MSPIQVTPGDLETVRAILARHVPDREIRAFGSRVTGKAKPFSDLDLVVMGNEPLPAAVLSDLADEFRESALPFKVDVVEWATTKEHFRRIIAADFVVVRPGR